MARRVLVLLVLAGAAILLAGCTALDGGDPSGGGLSPPGPGNGEEQARNHTLATWNQSGLLEAFPDTSESYEIRHVEPGDGIAYEAINLTEQEGELALKGVIWNGPSEDEESMGREQFRVEPPGALTALLEERRNRSEARDLFESFARNVTDAKGSTIDGWAESFVDSREEAGTGTDRRGRTVTLMAYRVALDEPLALDPLVEAIEGAGGERRETETGLHLENETWWLRFATPRASASGEDGHGRLEVTATSRDRAIALVGAPQPPSDEEVRERVRAAFEDLGLPEPTFDGLQTRSFEPR